MIIAVFVALVLAILMFDLLIVGRNQHVLSFKEATIWTLVWVSAAVAFYLFIYFYGEKIHDITDYPSLLKIKELYAPYLTLNGHDFLSDLTQYRKLISTEYITGYLMEYTLSLDNIFVIMLILASFRVEQKYYKEVLFWGILGALLLRFLFIFIGAALIMRFEWILYIFGGFLLFSGIKMLFEKEKEQIDIEKHALIRLLSKIFRLHPKYAGGKFLTHIDKKLYITPLLVVLIFIEFTDLVFAFDSIPAIFSVTRDPFIVFFSNIFAIVGLRSLFFFLSKIINMFRFLKIGISILLVFIGVKLLFHHYLEGIGFKTIYSLYFILLILAGSIITSVLIKGKKTTAN
jgi:tellurite resistance protein TerC